MKRIKIFIITFLFSYPYSSIASYVPVDGRVSYLVGFTALTNFQENFFSNVDRHSDLLRSQSFAFLGQALGDLNSFSSLIAEITLGTHKFCHETDTHLDDYRIDGITFDLGYRRQIIGNFWGSIMFGSLYPWRVSQKINSQPQEYDEHDFDSNYSVNLGIQYEGSWNDKPVSYDLRIKKYINGMLDDQMAIGFSIGWRFNSGE